jgi:hypothetical protein
MPEKMSVAFRHYLKTHKDLEVSPPTRIIPISSGVADITKEANETYLRVKNVQPFSKLTLFEGHGVGITAVEEKPVPLETAKILETAKADENGNYKFKLPAALSEKQDTEEKVCIVAIPPGNASKKVPVVSYPLALTESTK